jgi:hypothetical protein
MAATIVAGNFDSSSPATQAVEKLVHAGVAPDQVCVFFLNPPGQHATFPVGGDRNESAGATQTDSGAIKGAVVGGAIGLGAGAAAAAATTVAGPIAILAGLGVGAYTGSLAGALSKTGNKAERAANEPKPAAPRDAGMVVAVKISEQAPETLAIDVLREHGAHDIERAHGTWHDGKWEDFDPLSTPRRVEATKRNAS